MIHLSPLSITLPHSLNLKLPKYRIHLESSDYYPGQTLRGYFVMSSSKSFKFSHIKLIVEGVSHSSCSYRFGETLLLASACTLAGDPNTYSVPHSLGEGLSIFPFEIALPLTLTHTHRSKDNRHTSRVDDVEPNSNIYRVFVEVTVPPQQVRIAWCHLPFCVLAHPMHAVLDPSITIAPSTKAAQVIINLQGPSAAWRGETFPLTVSIQNNSTSTIDHVLVKLKMARWGSGTKNNSKWKRTGGEYKQSFGGEIFENEWKFPIDPSPIAPGQHWTNTVSIAIPTQIDLSILSTLSPLLQIGHLLSVKAISSGKSVPCNGNKKHPITVSDHYRTLEHLEPPFEAVGEVGKIIVAPATPEMSSKIVPSPALQTISFIPPAVSYIGGTSDSIARLPGAEPATTVPHTKVHNRFLMEGYHLTSDKWLPGSVPYWFNLAASSKS